VYIAVNNRHGTQPAQLAALLSWLLIFDSGHVLCVASRNSSSASHHGYQSFCLLSPGFYKTPDVTGFGGDRPFNYFTYGAAVAEVELDCLTGDFQVTASCACDLPDPTTHASLHGFPHQRLQ
jgi:Molybdopterin-binding domain of aldehyde dehydrogenase